MSSYVDRRVMEMRFDNKKFESNVAHTMETLDKLKANLNFKDAGNGLTQLQSKFQNVGEQATEAAKKTSKSWGEHLGELRNRFKLVDFVYLQTLDKWARVARETGTKIFHSLMLDDLWATNTKNIQAGWDKYESKASSVQTIMNSTGYSIEKVNKYLDKLMWYSDETSYSFADMTSALSSMLASGGDIEKLIPMIEGMANATSYAGKGSAEFNRVLYNLNQSYSQGYLSLMDWKSVQNAGVNSKALIDILIETGKTLGKIKGNEVTAANFTTKLADKWADSEVMEVAFAKFAEATEEAYAMVERGEVSTASEAYERLSKSMDGLGITAAKAAQEAKTFDEAMSSVKDAVATKWMTIFEYVFGNYQKSKATWSELANDLWEIFAGPFDDVQEISGFDALMSQAKAAGIDIDKLKQKMIELAIAEGTLSKEDAAAGDMFGEMADKSWITQKIFADAVDGMSTTIKKTTKKNDVEKLQKYYWTEWQNLMYKEWVENAGVEMKDLETWQLNSLGITRAEAAGVSKVTKEEVVEFHDLAEAIRDADGEYTELIDHINDPGKDKMGITTIMKKAFSDMDIRGLESSLDGVGLSIDGIGDHLIKAGIESGKVTQEMIDDAGGLIESLASGWLDDEIYTKALDSYVAEQEKAVEEIRSSMTNTEKYWYKLLVEKEGKTLSNMSREELDILGERGQMMARLKELKDYVKYVKQGNEETLKMLENRSGQSAIANSLLNLVQAFGQIKKMFANIFETIFPISDENKVDLIRDITYAIEEFTSKLIISDDAIDSICKVLSVVVDLIKLGINLLKSMTKPVSDFAKQIGSDMFNRSTKAMDDLINKTRGYIETIKKWLYEEGNLEKITGSITKRFALLRAVIDSIVDKFKTGEYSFKKIGNYAKTLYSNLKKKLVDLLPFLKPKEDGSDPISSLEEKFKSLKASLASIKSIKFETVKNFIDNILNFKFDFKDTVFEKISKWASETKRTITSFFDAVWTAAKWAYGAISKVAGWIGELIGYFLGPDFLDRMFEGAIEFGRIIRKAIEFKEFSLIIDIVKEIGKIVDALKVFKEITISFTSITDGIIDAVKLFAGSIDNVAKGIKTLGVGVELLGFAALIYSIAKAFDTLRDFNFAEDYQALAALIGLMGLVLTMVIILHKVLSATSEVAEDSEGDEEEAEEASNSILQSVAAVALIAGAVLALSVALKMIMDAIGSDPNSLWPALGIIAAVVAITTGAIALIGWGFKDVDTEGMAAALIAIPIAIAGLLLLVELISNYFLKIFENGIPGWKLGALAGGIVVVVLTIIGLVIMLKKLDGVELSNGIAYTLLSLGAVLLVVVLTVKMMGDLFERNWGSTLFGVVVILGAIAGILFLLSRFKDDTTITVKAAAAILSLGLVIVALTFALGLLSFLDTGKLIGAAFALGIVLGTMAASLWAASKIGKETKLGGLMSMILMLVVVVTAIIVLDKVIGDVLKTLLTAAAIAGSIGVIAIAMNVASKITALINWANILIMVGMFAAIAAIVGVTAAIVGDAKNFLFVALSISAALLAVGLTLRIVSDITRFINFASILMAMAALVIVAGSLVLIMTAFTKFSRVDIKDVSPVLITLAAGLGALAAVAALLYLIPGSILAVAGALAVIVGLAASLWLIAEAFNIFSIASERLSEIQYSVLGDELAEFGKKLKKADFSGLARLIDSVLSPFEGLGDALKWLGVAAGAAIIVPGVMDGITLAINGASRIADAFKTVAEGLAIIADSSDKINQFIPGAGIAISEFSQNLSNANFDSLHELLDLAASAFLPLVGLGIGSYMVNAAITGLGLKLTQLAFGIDAFRQSLGWSSNLGPQFVESIEKVAPYLEFGTIMMLNKQKKTVEDMDFTDTADAAAEKAKEVGSGFVRGLNPDNVPKDAQNGLSIDWARFFLGCLGVKTGSGVDAWDEVMEIDLPDGFFNAGEKAMEGLKEWRKTHDSEFSYSVEDWAEVLGLDVDVVAEMIEAAKEAYMNDTNSMLYKAFMDPDNFLSYDDSYDALPRYDGPSNAERIKAINTLLLAYLKNQAKSAEEEGISSEVKDAASDAAVTTVNAAEDVISEVTSQAESELTAEALNDLDEKARESLEKEAKQALKTLDTGNLISDAIANEIVNEYVQNGKSDLSYLANRVTEEVNKITQVEADEKSAEMSNDLGAAFSEFINGTIDMDTIKSIVAGMVDLDVSNLTDMVPDFIRDALEDTFGGMSAAEMVDKLKNMSTDDWIELGMAMAKNKGSEMFDGIKEGLMSYLGVENLDVSSLIGQLTGNFSDSLPEDYFSGTADLFGNEGDKCMQALTDALKKPENVELLQEAATMIANTIKEPFEAELSTEKMTTRGADAMTAIGSGITSRTITASSAAQRAKSSILSALDAYNSAYTIGVNLMLGVKAGILDTDLTSTVARVANAWINTMAVTLGISSSAKETIPIGKYFMQGVQIGIMDEQTSTFHTIDEIANAAVDHMAEALLLANEVVANAVDDQPTIRPLMDLSEIEDGAKRMNSLVNSDAARHIQIGREAMMNGGTENVQNGGKVINYTQNNYSPKSLSRIEIYRHTKNQLASIKA